jgi:hypothetical protein
MGANRAEKGQKSGREPSLLSRKSVVSYNRFNLLDDEQTEAVSEAFRALNEEQQHTFLERLNVPTKVQSGTKAGAGNRQPAQPALASPIPLMQKGKGVDPRNFGAIAFSEDEIDVELQQEAINQWKAIQRAETLQEHTSRRDKPERTGC